jgi:glycosyltransferase involved in cell wall biosynthesis
VELGILRNPRVIRILARVELALYAEATRIVTVTESFRRNLIERGVPADRVVTIPNGADLTTWQPGTAPAELRQRLNLDGRFVVLYLGNHGVSQRLGQVLDAAGRLRDRGDIQFLLVGDGPEKLALERRAREERLSNVQFLDPVGKQDVRAFYHLADACIVPLRNVPLFDTFIPSKMFEVLASGRPLIGALSGESAEILRASGGGIVVAPEDGAAIANAVLEVQRSSARARAMGTEGRAFVARYYSRAALAARYLDLLAAASSEYRARA